MTRQHTIALSLSLLAASTLSGEVGPSITPEVSSRPDVAGAPAESNVTPMWSSTLVGTATYPYAVAAAAALEEDGYTNWRLPTVEELQAAVTDADPNTFGQTTPYSAGLFFWTAKKQGNMWAFAVEVATDANGYPIPSLSGRVLKITQTSHVFVKCVRP